MTKTLMRWILTALAVSAAAAMGALAGEPVDGQLGFQPAATPLAVEGVRFHNIVLVIITGIVALVLGLMLYVMVRFRASAHPVPKKFSHNTTVEIIWTAGPVIILLIISFFSFPLLYLGDRVPSDYDLTVKTEGYQWAWRYEYPDHDIDQYNSIMLPEDRLAEFGHEQSHYRLAVNAPLVAPSGATVRVLVTASDVIHNWAVPAFMIKMDAIPGHTNETWFRVEEEGTYYGQCSELCGIKHALMPIQVDVVSPEFFEEWVAVARASGGASKDAHDLLLSYKAERDGGLQVAALTVPTETEE